MLFCLVFLTSIHAQNYEFVGIYIHKTEAENGTIQHKMVLDEAGTFLFSSFFSPTERDGKMLAIKSDYGSGKWRVNGDQVFFLVDRNQDFDTDRTLDFSKTRARLEKPSHQNSNVKKESVLLVFFDSDIHWLKGHRLIKQ
jgi:hypothetical protein